MPRPAQGRAAEKSSRTAKVPNRAAVAVMAPVVLLRLRSGDSRQRRTVERRSLAENRPPRSLQSSLTLFTPPGGRATRGDQRRLGQARGEKGPQLYTCAGISLRHTMRPVNVASCCRVERSVADVTASRTYWLFRCAGWLRLILSLGVARPLSCLRYADEEGSDDRKALDRGRPRSGSPRIGQPVGRDRCGNHRRGQPSERSRRDGQRHRPDVALLDIRMMDGGDDGLTALEQIHKDLPETRVVMLSAFDNPTYIVAGQCPGCERLPVERLHARATARHDSRRDHPRGNERSSAS